MTAVTTAFILKNVETSAVFFIDYNIEDWRNKIFTSSPFILLRGQPQKFVQLMEKALWMIKYVKNCLWSFILKTSHWNVLKSGRLTPVDSDQINTLIRNNQYYMALEIANLLNIFKN